MGGPPNHGLVTAAFGSGDKNIALISGAAGMMGHKNTQITIAPSVDKG